MLLELNDYTEAAEMADLPERLQMQWKGFKQASETFLGQPLYVTDEMISLMGELKFPEQLKSAILEQTGMIDSSQPLRLLARFLKWALFVDKEPWDNEIYGIDADAGILGEYKGIFILVVLCSGMISTLAKARDRRIPEEYLKEALEHFSDAVQSYYKRTNLWGIDNVAWYLLTTSFTLFQVGKYSFNINLYRNPAVLYRNRLTGEAALLSLPGYEYNRFGERVSYDQAQHTASDGGFVSYMKDTDEYVEGNYIYPIGYASREMKRLSKSEWEKVVYPGCVTLAYHIPTGIDYTAESVKIDFKKALDFYNKYFPEMKFSAFSCDSWLFSPQLQLMFDDSESKIVRVQRETYLQAPMSDDGSFVMFVFSGQKLDINTSPRDTALRKRIMEFMERGGRVRGGEMLLLPEDVDRQRPYYKPEHLAYIRKLYQEQGII